ncbi:MAG: GTP cyclohydrolase I FolE [Armatimonadota bacterium]|nr:GTP cyclohydrolase I FolE [Armatimonadota bacterium]
MQGATIRPKTTGGAAARRPSPRSAFDGPALEDAVRRIIEAVGEDPAREGLVDTPRRVAQMYAEVFEGLHQDPARVLAVGFDTVDHHEMVVLRDIPFASMCEHHFLPFRGVAHVGYLPNGRIVGISKIARAIEILARRPQVQERLTSQIADLLMDALRADGTGVVIEAEHLCMTVRGVKKPGSVIVTSAMRGAFRDDARTRAEFLSLIKRALP